MRFILLLCGGADATEQAADPTMPERCAAWRKTLQERGVRVSSTGLQPPDTATTVRVRGGEVVLSDGPFAETKEQIGGFSVVECADRATAVRAAAEHPWASAGGIEVRGVDGPDGQNGAEAAER